MTLKNGCMKTEEITQSRIITVIRVQDGTIGNDPEFVDGMGPFTKQPLFKFHKTEWNEGVICGHIDKRTDAACNGCTAQFVD